MTHPVIHGSFTVERTYPTTAAKLFRALSDPTKKRRWFAEGEGFIVESYTLDFKVDGFERSVFRFGQDTKGTYDAVYLDIVPEARLVYAYSMTIADAPLSSSLGTMELLPVDGGTLLRLTEHTAFVDGNDGTASRREGTMGLLDALARELATHG